MADVTVKKLGEMESAFDGAMVRARAALGVRSFGMQVVNLPPNADFYPEHDEAGTGQEEIYVPLEGSGQLLVDGQSYVLERGVFARVGPSARRQIVPGPKGIQILALGGVPGRAYEPPEWTELGAPTPEG